MKKFDLKSWITLMVTLTFCILTFYKIVWLHETDMQDFMTIVTMIYMFYFQKKGSEENDTTVKQAKNSVAISESREQSKELQENIKA